MRAPDPEPRPLFSLPLARLTWETERARFTSEERDYVETRLARLSVRLGAPGRGEGSDLQAVIDQVREENRGQVVIIRGGRVIVTGRTLDDAKAQLPAGVDRAMIVRVAADGSIEEF